MCKMNASFSKVTLIVSAWTLVLIAGVRYRWGITNLAYLQMANERVRPGFHVSQTVGDPSLTMLAIHVYIL